MKKTAIRVDSKFGHEDRAANAQTDQKQYDKEDTLADPRRVFPTICKTHPDPTNPFAKGFVWGQCANPVRLVIAGALSGRSDYSSPPAVQKYPGHRDPQHVP